MKTASQHNAEHLSLPTFTSDEIRRKLVEQFEKFKPTLQSYHDYAEQTVALGLEYHLARLGEVFPKTPVEELTLAATFDARETPKSLDVKLAQLGGVPVKRVVFDRTKSTFYLFV
jgi:hypothetical protein